jgi:hypothetical protein
LRLHIVDSFCKVLSCWQLAKANAETLKPNWSLLIRISESRLYRRSEFGSRFKTFLSMSSMASTTRSSAVNHFHFCLYPRQKFTSVPLNHSLLLSSSRKPFPFVISYDGAHLQSSRGSRSCR